MALIEVTDLPEQADVGLVDNGSFFAPASFDLFDNLLAQYQRTRAEVAEVAAYFADRMAAGAAIHYFLDGNKSDDRGRHSMSMSAQQLFNEAGAVHALNAAYWSKALQTTDVFDLMPQKRRNEWNEQMLCPEGRKKDWHTVRREQEQSPELFDAKGEYFDPTNAYSLRPLPDFTEDNVRSTIVGLLNMRAQFFGERVDGIFRGLSGEHVTNAPEAFGKRMIIARVLGSCGYAEHTTCGLINDLRCVVAKFMGRDEPKYQSSDALVNRLKGNWGKWVTIDGGAMRIRLYMKGTAHLEVHPDMAWRLNQVLASLYPLAIPPEFRVKPKRRVKEVPLMKRPLSFRTLELLAQADRKNERVSEWPERYRRVPNTLVLRDSESAGPAAMKEAEGILQAIGGTKDAKGVYWFDYDPTDVVAEIVTSGCVPDRQAHQFYPTPGKLARICADLAEIGDDHIVLEPSAGHGDLAAFLPKDRTTCVEVSTLRVAVLQARGFTTVADDFLQYADQLERAGARFDRVVMNPPFADGRARAHIEAAASLLRLEGRLVAILPSSLRNTEPLGAGFDHHWSHPYDNEFPGTSVSVVILTANRKGSVC